MFTENADLWFSVNLSCCIENVLFKDNFSVNFFQIISWIAFFFLFPWLKLCSCLKCIPSNVLFFFYFFLNYWCSFGEVSHIGGVWKHNATNSWSRLFKENFYCEQWNRVSLDGPYLYHLCWQWRVFAYIIIVNISKPKPLRKLNEKSQWKNILIKCNNNNKILDWCPCLFFMQLLHWTIQECHI